MTSPSSSLISLPDEVQVHILSFLRSFDLGPVVETCRFYHDPQRIHQVVDHFVHHVYGTEYTKEIIETMKLEQEQQQQEVSSMTGRGGGKNHRRHHGSKKNKPNHHQRKPPPSAASSNQTNKIIETNETKDDDSPRAFRYTLLHLRSIELAVVAHVLSLPEPKSGYFVSKSWIKKTLLWLEKVNDTTNEAAQQAQHTPKKKLTKKQQRQRARRLSDVSAPSLNANSDIVCEHQNLQRSGAKAARSHRRLMDKKSWRVLKKLYPDSTQLDSVQGECLQCLMEQQTFQKQQQDELEKAKQERKQPLSNFHIRRFYTRTRGVPYHCLKDNTASNTASNSTNSCPLSPGTYVILPRAWCHQWRRYMKTGEGCTPLPPDSSALLCDAHKLALLPPHLEAFLRGETPQLYSSVKESSAAAAVSSPQQASAAAGSNIATLSSLASASTNNSNQQAIVPRSPVGLQPVLDPETVRALQAAGISPAEVATQRMAFTRAAAEARAAVIDDTATANNNNDLRTNATHSASASSSSCNNELLDRENHIVTELVTHDEWLALQETGGWSSSTISLAYSMCVTVDEHDGSFAFSTLPCRECDPTGLRFGSSCVSSMMHQQSTSAKKCAANKNTPKYRRK